MTQTVRNKIDLLRLEGDVFCTHTRMQCFTPISIHLSLAWHIIKVKSFTGIKKVQDFMQVLRMSRTVVANPKKKKKDDLQTFLPPDINEFSTHGSWEKISQRLIFKLPLAVKLLVSSFEAAGAVCCQLQKTGLHQPWVWPALEILLVLYIAKCNKKILLSHKKPQTNMF